MPRMNYRWRPISVKVVDYEECVITKGKVPEVMGYVWVTYANPYDGTRHVTMAYASNKDDGCHLSECSCPDLITAWTYELVPPPYEG